MRAGEGSWSACRGDARGWGGMHTHTPSATHLHTSGQVVTRSSSRNEKISMSRSNGRAWTGGGEAGWAGASIAPTKKMPAIGVKPQERARVVLCRGRNSRPRRLPKPLKKRPVPGLHNINSKKNDQKKNTQKCSSSPASCWPSPSPRPSPSWARQWWCVGGGVGRVQEARRF